MAAIQTFGWMTTLMAKGASKFITEDDLPSLVPSDESENLGNRLQKYLIKYGVWKSLFLAYGGPYLVAVILKVFQVSYFTHQYNEFSSWVRIVWLSCNRNFFAGC